MRFLLLLALAGLVPSLATAVEDPLAPFMAQSVCLDARDAPRPGHLPFEPGCERSRPLSLGDPLPYRKHDWPGAADAAARSSGYQASDSLFGTLLGRPAILQTFDFGGGARAFNRFDAEDGGRAVLLRDGAAASPLTQDGGGGVQWFQSPDCGAAGGPAPGWLFAALPLAEAWRERVVRLNKSRGPDQCPTAFNQSLTRWRTARMDLPWREAATGAVSVAPAVEALVSEHFGTASVGTADHLERFWFVRGLGLARWERWEQSARSRLPGRERMARLIAESGRCPPIAFGEPPAAGWQLVDCRTWTNMARAAPGAPLSALAWPAPELR